MPPLYIDTTAFTAAGCATANRIAAERLWKSRSVENSQSRLFHCAWKSRKRRGIPTFPQPRRRRPINLKTDISYATKTGHFNLQTTPAPNLQMFSICVPAYTEGSFTRAAGENSTPLVLSTLATVCLGRSCACPFELTRPPTRATGRHDCASICGTWQPPHFRYTRAILGSTVRLG
jgi:hypothetical protein